MLLDKSSLETEYRKLLFYNPWMLGSQYSEAVAQERSIWLKTRADLLLVSALGYVDIVEVKRPDISILVRGTMGYTWRASAELSDAQAQARFYLRLLDKHHIEIEDELGLAGQSMSRMYRSAVLILIGRSPTDKEARNALKDFNISDPRILVMTYDDALSIQCR
ncbi:MAG: Shedu anti-phage system protein SduA domain-containing protein [Desulfobaccales bacterium]